MAAAGQLHRLLEGEYFIEKGTDVSLVLNSRPDPTFSTHASALT